MNGDIESHGKKSISRRRLKVGRVLDLFNTSQPGPGTAWEIN